MVSEPPITDRNPNTSPDAPSAIAEREQPHRRAEDERQRDHHHRERRREENEDLGRELLGEPREDDRDAADHVARGAAPEPPPPWSLKAGSATASRNSEIACWRWASLRPGRSRTEISAASELGTIAASRGFGTHLEDPPLADHRRDEVRVVEPRAGPSCPYWSARLRSRCWSRANTCWPASGRGLLLGGERKPAPLRLAGPPARRPPAPARAACACWPRSLLAWIASWFRKVAGPNTTALGSSRAIAAHGAGAGWPLITRPPGALPERQLSSASRRPRLAV